jgi:hypothetical protein
MNELPVNLAGLDLTDDERLELESARAFMNSDECANVTSAQVMQKHYELVFAQTVAMLCETPEGIRDDAYLFEAAGMLADLRYFQSISNMASKMAEQALDDKTKTLLSETAQSLAEKAMESAQVLWDFMVEDDIVHDAEVGAGVSILDQTLTAIFKDTKFASLTVEPFAKLFFQAPQAERII